MGSTAVAVPTKVEEQLCFQLYAASRAITAAYRKGLAEIGLTYPQYLTLLSLWEHDAQTVSELGTRLNLDSGTLSPLVKRLVSLDLVRKTRSALDERSVTIELTPKGRALESQAGEVRAAVENSTGLAPHEFKELRGLLQSLREAVEENPPLLAAD